MAARPRRHKGLPDNLYPAKRGGKTYYRYRRPDTGTWHGVGADRQAAIRAAKRLNATLTPSGDATLERRVYGAADPLTDYLDRFETDILPSLRHKRTGLPYSGKTLGEYRRMLRQIRGELGATATDGLTRRQVADFLAQFPTTASNRYRALLSLVYRYAVAEGRAEANPVDGTLPHTEIVERRRLDEDAFWKIHEKAEPWMQRAMEGSLLTLQARQTIVRVRFDHEQDGWLYLERPKVRGHGHGKIRVKVGPQIRAWIDRCRDGLLSPYLIHREPEKRRREYWAKKDHWTQVAPEMLTREFKRLRDQEGVYDHLEPSQRPSWHEIRALGGDLKRQEGWSEEAIQRLYGHTSGKMTRTYLDGHGDRWVDADAI